MFAVATLMSFGLPKALSFITPCAIFLDPSYPIAIGGLTVLLLGAVSILMAFLGLVVTRLPFLVANLLAWLIHWLVPAIVFVYYLYYFYSADLPYMFNGSEVLCD